MSKIKLVVTLVVGLGLGVLAGFFLKPSVAPAVLGGSIHNTQESFDEGIAVDGTAVINGSGVLVGTVQSADIRATSLVETGTLESFTTNTAITAAQLCDDGAFTATSSLSVTLTLPSTTTLFADCLTTNGDSLSMPVYNGSSTTTILVAGGGGELLFSSSTTLSPLDGARLDIIRLSSTAYEGFVHNVR